MLFSELFKFFYCFEYKKLGHEVVKSLSVGFGNSWDEFEVMERWDDIRASKSEKKAFFPNIQGGFENRNRFSARLSLDSKLRKFHCMILWVIKNNNVSHFFKI